MFEKEAASYKYQVAGQGSLLTTCDFLPATLSSSQPVAVFYQFRIFINSF